MSISLAAIASRLLFWLATPDRHWGWSAYFKGDAPLWLEYARAIQTGQPFELGLPIHPPGAAWLVALLWNGSESGIGWLRFSWLVLGALVPLLVFLAAERSFGMRVAAVAGGACAISAGLMLLSTSINNETPYLVLAMGSMCLVKSLRERPSAGMVVAWSGLNSIACLFRVEHLLFVLAALALFSAGWMRSHNRAAPKWLLIALIAFVLPLVPWHLTAWRAVRDFNEKPRALVPMEERAVRGVEEALIDVRWTPEAQQRRNELPAFLRRTIGVFVLATVDHRGGREVRASDFDDILAQGFGYVPRPLNRFPFVSSYGPLNFSLANHGTATGGFDRSLLEAQPPLRGGAARYPPFMVQGLPPPQLSFVYPPHLHLFNDGYAIGWKWIAGHPRQFGALALRKLSIFWSGAALGVTGWNVPIGLSGTRRSVDLVVPERGWTGVAWGAVLFVLAAIGMAAGWQDPDLWPWLLFIASKVAVAVLFFGYARLGATIIPGMAILVALALSRRSGERPALVAILVLCVGMEAARYLTGPALSLDDQPVGIADSYERDLHRDQRLDVSK